jgi:hypothetical protein
MRIRGAAWAGASALIVAGAVVLAGCTGDDPEPTPTTTSSAPTSSTSEPTTSEPTVAAPEIPAEAAAQTPEGAAAFTGYWIDLMNHAYATGDTQPLEAITSPDCTECRGFVTDLQSSLRGGNRIEGGSISVANLVGGLLSADNTSIVSGSFEQAASTTVAPDGEVVEETPATARQPIAFYCSWSGSGWTLRRVVAVQ